MLQDCINRLKWIGYTYDEAKDKELLNYLMVKVSTEVKVFCNILEIPTELHSYVIDRAAGEFLLNKKDCGLLDLETIDFDGVAKSIQLGDTKVELSAEYSPEKRFDALISYLVTNKKDVLISFRRLKW